MRILLLGGSGLLSGEARHAFLAAGHDVAIVSRGGRAVVPHARLRTLRADRTQADSLAGVLTGERFDLSVDFLGFGAADVGRLGGLIGFDPGRLVLISSGQVYLVAEHAAPPFREADAERRAMPEPPAATRDHGEWSYGMGKRAAEAALVTLGAERGWRVLALRLPVVQGEADGSASRRLWGWLERLRDGGPVLLPDEGRQPVRFVYAADVAAALVSLAERTAWPGVPALNLAQPDECTLREFLEGIARHAGVPAHWCGVSAATLAAAGLADTCAPWWGRWCSRPDPTLAVTRFGFRTTPWADYLGSVVRAHLESPPPRSHPGYSRRAAERALAAGLRESGA